MVVLSMSVFIVLGMQIWEAYVDKTRWYQMKVRGRRLLCCAVLCCAVLCCAVLCCAVLCCAVLCCAVLCCTVLYCTALYCYALSAVRLIDSLTESSGLDCCIKMLFELLQCPSVYIIHYTSYM